jgi:hypothetical protein
VGGREEERKRGRAGRRSEEGAGEEWYLLEVIIPSINTYESIHNCNCMQPV